MSRRGVAFWALSVSEAGGAAALLVFYRPPAEDGVVGGALGLVLGAATGYALVVVLGRGRPPIGRVAPARRVLVAAKGAILALGATCEEVVWRWFGVGALAPRIGLAPAVGLSAVVFALCHVGQAPRAFGVHLVTGTAFGSVFAVTGSLAAAALAHGTYNVTVLLALEARRAVLAPTPGSA